jgi:hypothetical protein
MREYSSNFLLLRQNYLFTQRWTWQFRISSGKELNTRAASSWKVPEIIGTTRRRADDDRNVLIGTYSSNFKYEGQSSQFIALYANLAR